MYCVTPSIFVNGPSCKSLLMMLFFSCLSSSSTTIYNIMSLFQTLGINIVVTVLRWGSYNFYNCFETLQRPEGEGIGHLFGAKKDTPKCSLVLVNGPPLSGWLPGKACLVRGGPSQKTRAAFWGGGWQQLAGCCIRFQSCLPHRARSTKATVGVRCQ